MTTLLPESGRVSGVEVVAHRGFSSRQPEMTLAAYREALEWSLTHDVPLGWECDVRFSADRELVCLHDAALGRTSSGRGLVAEWPVAALRSLDFGSWRVPVPNREQRTLVTLADLLSLVAGARARGADVRLVVETKHPCDCGLQLEQRVCDLLAEYGWTGAGAPVRLITFSVPGAELLADRVPEVDRSLLVRRDLGDFADGALPRGVGVVGVELALLLRDPGFVERVRAHGNEVHVWTVNEVADIAFCRDLGVTGITSDYPDRVVDVLCAA